MSRRHRAEKREVNPDPKFGEVVITKFMNAVMNQGKKSVAERIVYGAFDRMETKAKSDPVQLFRQALSLLEHAAHMPVFFPQAALEFPVF